MMAEKMKPINAIITLAMKFPIILPAVRERKGLPVLDLAYENSSSIFFL